MTFDINYQEHYSRGELLLRTLFGFFYIALPHSIILLFLSLAGSVLTFLTFWVILFTGRHPQSWFEFQVKLMRWNLRVNARLLNLSDGYPAFGMNAEDDLVTFDVTYKENYSRSSVLLRGLFGIFYVWLPHGIVLGLLSYVVIIFQFIGWWAVLFTAKYPKSLFDFTVDFLRWNQRVVVYMSYMSDDYPPFTGKALASETPAPTSEEA